MYNAHLLKIAIIVHVFITSIIAQESLIGQTAPELGIEKFLQAPEIVSEKIQTKKPSRNSKMNSI